MTTLTKFAKDFYRAELDDTYYVLIEREGKGQWIIDKRYKDDGSRSFCEECRSLKEAKSILAIWAE